MRDGEVLDVFLRRVDELRATRLIRSGALSDAFHIGATKGQAAVFSVSHPDEDDFRSFLLSFRHLVATKEPATLDRVANIVIGGLEPNRLRDIVEQSGAPRVLCRSHTGAALG